MQMLASGVSAPQFRLHDLSGKGRSLDDVLTGGPAVLAFFKVSCPVCQLALPFLDRLSRASSIGFYGISQDDVEATGEFRDRFGLSFPMLLDEEDSGYSASNAYGISSVPSMFLVEPDGSISWASSGFSKRDLEDLGRRAGSPMFAPGEYVPEWKAG